MYKWGITFRVIPHLLFYILLYLLGLYLGSNKELIILYGLLLYSFVEVLSKK